MQALYNLHMNCAIPGVPRLAEIVLLTFQELPRFGHKVRWVCVCVCFGFVMCLDGSSALLQGARSYAPRAGKQKVSGVTLNPCAAKPQPLNSLKPRTPMLHPKPRTAPNPKPQPSRQSKTKKSSKLLSEEAHLHWGMVSSSQAFNKVG